MLNTQEILNAKNEIVKWTGEPPEAIAARVDCEAMQEQVMDGRKQIKDRTAWFKVNVLDFSEAVFQQAKETLAAHKTVLKELLQPLVDWEAAANAVICAYTLKETKEAQAKQDKANIQYVNRLHKAEEKGKDLSEVKPATLVKAAPKTTKTTTGGYTVKMIKKLVIVDHNLIPDYYFDRVLNEKVLKAALVSGKIVPGAVLQEVAQSAVSV